jgi:hypothetical protein
MRFLLLWTMLVCGAAWAGAATVVPWKEGERLRYEIYWGIVMAAEAEAQVKRVGNFWDTELELRTRGLVEAFFPMRSTFAGRMSVNTLRARRFEAERLENKRRRSQLILLNPEAKSAAYTDRVSGQTVRFVLPDEETQTLLTLLYAARAVPWARGVERTWDVCDRDQLKRVRLRCVGEEERSLGKGAKAKKLLVIQAEEVANAAGRAPRRPLRARVWLNPQGMVPEAVDLSFIYGTFNLRRVPEKPS